MNIQNAYDEKKSGNLIATIKDTYKALFSLLSDDTKKDFDDELGAEFLSFEEDSDDKFDGKRTGTGTEHEPGPEPEPGPGPEPGPRPRKKPSLIQVSAKNNGFTWTVASDIDDDDLARYFKKGVRWKKGCDSCT